MDCVSVREKIHLYLDNQLTALEADELKEHINKCEKCQKEVAIWQELVVAIKRPILETPDDLTKKIMLSIPERVYKTRSYNSIFWLTLFLITSILFAFCWIFRYHIFMTLTRPQFWDALLWISVGCITTVIGLQIAYVLSIMAKQRAISNLK